MKYSPQIMSKWSLLLLHVLVFEVIDGNIASGNKNRFELSKSSNNRYANCWTDFQCKKCGLLRGKDFVRMNQMFDL